MLLEVANLLPPSTRLFYLRHLHCIITYINPRCLRAVLTFIFTDTDVTGMPTRLGDDFGELYDTSRFGIELIKMGAGVSARTPSS